MDASSLDKAYVLIVGLTFIGGVLVSTVAGVTWLNTQFRDRDAAYGKRFKERDELFDKRAQEADRQAKAVRALVNTRIDRLDAEFRAHERDLLNLRNDIALKLAFIPTKEQIDVLLDKRLKPMANGMRSLLRELGRLGVHDVRLDVESQEITGEGK